MAEPKTKLTNQNPKEFLSTVEPQEKQADSLTLLQLFEEVTGEVPKMWGAAMIGFGTYHYKSERSSQEGDWFRVGFSPRKQNLTLYILHGNTDSALLEKLGKHKRSSSGMGGCLYLNKLADVDMKILAQLIKHSYDYMNKQYPSSK